MSGPVLSSSETPMNQGEQMRQPMSAYQISNQTMSVRDMREIAQSYNKSMNKYTNEKTMHQKTSETLQIALQKKQEFLSQLVSQRAKLIMNNKALQSDIDTQSLKRQVLDVTRQEALKDVDLNNLSDNQRLLLTKRDELLRQNEQLRQEICQESLSMKIRERKCQNCKGLFMPLHNTENSCRYHVGKLKFYSCRGCGADQYYTCCNKCNQCNPGCKYTKHVA
ncbi:hypothetical protein FGO68_gene10487 [Halteria grandinella]|uniref:Uncharacterized protein n=1 Tax=Halteria grandinella TaxID=5974 RepID=A0A8J8NBP1_HALGN|nr:hypothetical protein FGO68_gene10487 [Halteria grandinella]